jgi:hypothetical protein
VCPTKTATHFFKFKGPCIVKYRPIIVQQDATIYSLFMPINRSKYFGWFLHPSSGAHVTISTASGISKTVTATCRERDWTFPLQSRSRQVDGRRYQPKHVEWCTDINKLYTYSCILLNNYWLTATYLYCNVATCFGL